MVKTNKNRKTVLRIPWICNLIPCSSINIIYQEHSRLSGSARKRLKKFICHDGMDTGNRMKGIKVQVILRIGAHCTSTAIDANGCTRVDSDSIGCGIVVHVSPLAELDQ